MKTSELIGPKLDSAVAIVFNPGPEWGEWSPSTKWAQGSVLIEREGIDVWYRVGVHFIARIKDGPEYTGPTQLVAAMRCYVASKCGDDIQIEEMT